MTQLAYTIFQDAFFPDADSDDADGSYRSQLRLEKVTRFQVDHDAIMQETPLVVFDFETTGLDTQNDYVIEVGALKTLNGRICDEFSFLIQPPIPLTESVTTITGITTEMLQGQPTIDEVLPQFLAYIENSILVAHNAAFDMAFLQTICARQGIQIEWPAFCTLRMARQLLPQLESKNLDSLAEHYHLTFEARHRSIGDCKVTSAVLQSMLAEEAPDFVTWQHFQPFVINSK